RGGGPEIGHCVRERLLRGAMPSPAAARPPSQLARTLLALSDPTRRPLVERLGRRPLRPTDLGRGLPITRPAVSRHLRVLRNAGLVEAVPQGREILYQLAGTTRGIGEARAAFERLSRHLDLPRWEVKKFADQQH